MIKFGSNKLDKLDKAIEMFEVGYGRKLTPVEREIFKAGFYAGFEEGFGR